MNTHRITFFAKAIVLAILLAPCLADSFQTPVILGNGNTNGINVATSNDQGNANGGKTLDGEAFLPSQMAASRFLAQASLGADFETIMAMSDLTYNESARYPIRHAQTFRHRATHHRHHRRSA